MDLEEARSIIAEGRAGSRPRDVQFNAEGLDSKQADNVARTNAALTRLAARRKAEIGVVDHLERSKLAWKLATLEEAILYRMVALLRGAAVTWNSGNLLACILLCRAIIETFVLSEDLKVRVETRVASEDLSAVSALLDHQTFASRDPEWLAVSESGTDSPRPRMSATSVCGSRSTVLRSLADRRALTRTRHP